MRCIVEKCNNVSRRNQFDEISFHLFPLDPVLRQDWLCSLGMDDAEVKGTSSICSSHFNDEDFCEAQGGDKKLKNGAVPVIGVKPENFESSALSRVCRICMAIGVKMYDSKTYNLGDIYQQITGIIWTEQVDLPQCFCWECAGRLLSSYKLFKKALSSHKAILELLKDTRHIRLKDILTINRGTSSLQKHFIQEKDYYIFEEDLSHNNLADNQEQLIKEEYGDKTIGEPLQVLEDNLPDLETIDVKDESGVDFFDEFDNFNDSDDNVKLSEVANPEVESKPKCKVKKKKLKVEKIVKVKVVKEKKKRDKEEEDNPMSTIDKYKTSDVKRRKTNEGPDDSLFIISNLSYEEQIADIYKRQDTTAYKNAPYKCTACFRGFQIQERYDAHIVRHSDQSGSYECFICKTRLKTGRALRKHLTGQHTEKFSCKGCPFVTRNRGVAREHEKWHAGTKYQCPHCPSEFDKVTTYMGHIRIKHVSDFVCELCGFTFVSKKGIEVHKKKKHRLSDKNVNLEGPYCCVCDVTFLSEEAHSRHLKLSSRHSSDNDPNRIRNDSQSLHTERHGRVVRRIERRPVIHPRDPADRTRGAEPGPVTCEQCGMQLRDLRLYAQHFRRAHPDKNRTKYPAMKTPCMCEQCGRIFQSMALLKDHMWVHTGEKRFKCDRCEKSFTQKTNLVFHMRVHSAARPTYECPLCGKHFAFYNNRRRHMFIHTGLKPFKCDTCGKCFTTAGEQRAHVEHVHMKKPWPKRARTRQQDWHKCAVDGAED